MIKLILTYYPLSTFSILFSSFWIYGTVSSHSSVSFVKVRFANPDWNSPLDRYYNDVEVRSDTADFHLFGIHVRFFYNDIFSNEMLFAASLSIDQPSLMGDPKKK